MSIDEFVPIYNAANEYNASIIKSVLEDEGIQTIIEPVNKSLAFNGAIALAEGSWGVIMVHKSDEDRAIRILNEYTDENGDSEE